MSTSRRRQYDGRFSASGCSEDPSDCFSLGKNKKERPNPSTKIPVTINKGRAPVNFVRREPRMVAGTPIAMLHQTICQSSRRDCQYSPEATSVPGMVAGSGDATAMNPG